MLGLPSYDISNPGNSLHFCLSGRLQQRWGQTAATTNSMCKSFPELWLEVKDLASLEAYCLEPQGLL